MRNLFLACLWFSFLFSFLLRGYSLANQPDRERIAEILSAHHSTLATARVYRPDATGIQTRSPAGPRLYKQVVSGTVLVFTKSGYGSGVRVGRGMILTNWHVVAGNEYAAILFWRPELTDVSALKALDAKNWISALVVEGDSTRDLALLVVDPKQVPQHATIIASGRLADISIGQDVFAIGHPQDLFWSYTEGVVSHIRANYAWKSESGIHQATIIQTQTPVSFGSSGGPLFDQTGRLIGLNTGSKAPGLNFSVAINEVTNFTFGVISRFRK